MGTHDSISQDPKSMKVEDALELVRIYDQYDFSIGILSRNAVFNPEDELNDFINFDTVFINSPGFYTKLIAFLVRHTIRLLRTVASYPIFIYFLLFSVQETESACAKVSSFSVMFSIAES